MKLCWPAACLIVLGCVLTAQAEHAIISLKVFHYNPQSLALENQAEATMDHDPPMGGLNPRPLLKSKAGEPLVMQFFFTNTYPHKDIKDAAVRYFVVREEKPNQKQLPDLSKDVVTDGKFSLNFKPQGKVGARLAFTITKPGIYLLRVESVNTQSDHEHFAAIDLQIE
jgi:hypothetical protein